jgi:hypothetical protein
VALVRTCRVTLRDVDGVAHQVEVQGSSLFAAAAAAVAAFRQQGWATAALTPTAVLRVEVQSPSVVHDVPLKAVERWLGSPTDSPRDQLLKRQLGDRGEERPCISVDTAAALFAAV